MGEADWWLCATCQSLNNLSARKCYSCRAKKPKQAVHASQLLGYQPVESWDGRITMRMNEWPDAAQDEADSQAKPPPLRDPIQRDTLAVAPRPPQGARIEYRDPPEIAPPAPDLWTGIVAPPSARVQTASFQDPQGFVAVGPVARSDAPDAPDPSTTIAAHQAEQRSHWQYLLDGPTPDADRLRKTYAATDRSRDSGESTGPRDGFALHRAIRGIGYGEGRRSRPLVIWPEADLAQSSRADASASGREWTASTRSGPQPAT
jgi:hypothetical protein